MDRPHAGGGVSLLAGLLFLGAAPACDGGDPVEMSGHQVLAGRDLGGVFFWKPRTLGFTRDAAEPSQPEPEDFWVWGLDEPAPSMALAGVHFSPPASWPRWVAGDLMLTGTELERVYDIETRRAADLRQELPGQAAGPSTVRALMATSAMRSDGHGMARVLGNTVVVGRPPDLRAHTLPDGATVGGIAFVGQDLALLLRQTTAGGDVVGVERLDTATGALATLVPPTSAGEWVGIAGFCEDESTGPCGFFGAVGCGIDQPVCADGRAAPCLVVYGKADPDDPARTAAYVHDVGAGTGRRLAGSDTDSFVVDRPNHLLTWASSTERVTRYWNICGETSGQCPGWNELVTFRPDGGAFALYGAHDSLRIVDVAGGTCTAPDAGMSSGVRQAQYSSGSDRLWWIAGNREGTAQTLWLADAAGQAPVAITSGPFLGAGFTPDGRALYVSHVEESTAALGWVDVGAPAPAEQILSTNYGDVVLLGSRRAVFVDHFNAQDGNGELVQVELPTGATRSLARAVTGAAIAARPEDDGTDLAYTVRGRAGSSRDGLWLTTLPP